MNITQFKKEIVMKLLQAKNSNLEIPAENTKDNNCRLHKMFA